MTVTPGQLAPRTPAARTRSGGHGPDGFQGDGGHGDGRGGGPDGYGAQPRRIPRRSYFTGLWLAQAGMAMFFAAFASSYVVRRGVGTEWSALELPSLLWVNTAILVGSSLAIEIARRALRADRMSAFRGWWALAAVLGVAFLAGQGVVWQQLVAQGINITTNASHSFFYLLTAAHGLHLLVGVGVLGYVAMRAWRRTIGARDTLAADLSAVYWHFLDGLWVCVLALFLLWR